jgi:hydrogenase-4 component B
MIPPVLLICLFFLLCLTGAVLAALLPERKNPSALAWIGSGASLILMLASGEALFGGAFFQGTLLTVPLAGAFILRMDSLSALLLFVAGMVFLPVSMFSAGYLGKYLGQYSLRAFGMYYHLLFASIALVLMAGDAVLFLLSWESVSIFSYLLVNYEHQEEEKTRAGFLMLSMSEAGTLAIVLAFLILAKASGGLDFTSLKNGALTLGHRAHWAVFLLAFLGFGVKAGLVPFSSWLPKAHPAAPGNVSALLSGVIVNLGIYGILRVNGDVLAVRETGQGLVVLVIGSLSALIGILYATIRNDMKRMLAHSSIENMGIVVVGLGAGFEFGALGLLPAAGIAFLAALYHMGNHSLYKSLLFLGAASVDSRCNCRDMDRMGGLIRVMPWTSLFFLVGALSISALPPFNGFVSEWLTLQTMLRSALIQSPGVKIVFALCGAGLALTAGLAVTCFVKAFAVVFLGMARSKEAERAGEVRLSMRLGMAILAICCFLLGLLPTYVVPVLDKPVIHLVGAPVTDELVPPFFTVERGDTKWEDGFVSEFRDLGAQVGRGHLPGRGLVVLHRGTEKNPVVFAMSSSYTLGVLIVLLVATYAAVRWLTRGRTVTRQPAWDGGLRRLLPEMTYTATGFSNPVRVVFEAIFRPSQAEDTRETVAEHFRAAIVSGRTEEPHLLDRLVYQPALRISRRLAEGLARMHAGSVNVYAAYVLISLLCLILLELLLWG